MSRKCELTGKSPLKGHKVSHANNKMKRKFFPNLKNVTFKSNMLKRNIRLSVSNAALRTVDYMGGIDFYLKNVKSFKLSPKAKKLKNTMFFGPKIAISNKPKTTPVWPIIIQERRLPRFLVKKPT